MNNLSLALRLLARDWRAGELRVLLAALVLAVTAVSSVGFFADRVRLALERQAAELLGADLVISADHPVAPALLERAPAPLARARSLEFPSMAVAGDQAQLAAVQAVSTGYPPRGRLRIAPGAFAVDRPAAGVPPPGEIWVESRLLAQLGIAVGDSIGLGTAQLRVAAVLTDEPASAGFGLFNIAPRLLMNEADVVRTGLVQPASRVRYRYLYAGDPALIAAWRTTAAAALKPGERLEGVEDARPEMRSALERARRFLGLAALVSVLLAGMAVALSTQRFIARHLDVCAVMRCLGARQSLILRLYLWQMVVLGAAAAVIGCGLGYLGQLGLERILGALAGIALPPPSPRPALLGAATALVTQLGFALPPLLALKEVPALRVLRRDRSPVRVPQLAVYGAGACAIALLIIWQSGDATLGLDVVLGAAVAAVVLAFAAAALVALLRAFGHRMTGSWRFGALSMARRPGATVAQVAAFGLGIMVLLLLTVVRGDLMAEWERSLPPDAPNRFLINVQPEQRAALRAFFSDRGRAAPALFPMVRGRLLAINGQPAAAERYQDERAQRLVAREFNLSWAERLQPDNRIVAGHWWPPGARDGRQVSVEEGLAETLGIRLGDTLTFRIGGDDLAVTVSSLRKVQWDSFRVNFFVLAPPGVLDDYPVSYIASLYLPAADAGLLNGLVRKFPNVTVIDVAAVMEQVRGIMDRVALAVEYVFLFTLLSGLLVMYAAVYATLDERLRESVLLRTLGANRVQLLKALAMEFLSLGLLSGLIAATAAAALGFLLARRLFNLEYGLDPGLWLIGGLAGALGIGIAGVLSTRFVLRIPPVQALRQLP